MGLIRVYPRLSASKFGIAEGYISDCGADGDRSAKILAKSGFTALSRLADCHYLTVVTVDQRRSLASATAGSGCEDDSAPQRGRPDRPVRRRAGNHHCSDW